MPDPGLIQHQWNKHGTCAGLDQASYAQDIRDATARVAIPQTFQEGNAQRLDARDVERLFTAANPGLTQEGVAVSCRSGRFAEVRICLSHDLDFRACTQVDRNGCGQSNLEVLAR
ncbi:MAG: hypothetical protein KI785_04675 [Devosiaceae bacterium]|nr:hypothetical protein [Devosiaceae bacterium MH13]